MRKGENSNSTVVPFRSSELTPQYPLIASALLYETRHRHFRSPAAVGPYSQAIAVGGLLFCAGQIPLDPATSELVGTDVTAQTERVCQNISAVLKANGFTFSNVVKTTVFLTDLSNFATMNAVYSKFFTEPFPARSTIQVAGLPRGAQVEIEVTASAE